MLRDAVGCARLLEQPRLSQQGGVAPARLTGPGTGRTAMLSRIPYPGDRFQACTIYRHLAPLVGRKGQDRQRTGGGRPGVRGGEGRQGEALEGKCVRGVQAWAASLCPAAHPRHASTEIGVQSHHRGYDTSDHPDMARYDTCTAQQPAQCAQAGRDPKGYKSWPSPHTG